MRNVWVVVANSAAAKIYRAENVNTLVFHKDLAHIESRLHDHDMISDGPGKMGRNGRYGLDVVEPKTTYHEKEVKLFALEIAKTLETGVEQGLCERIYLVAKAPFLGTLRESLSPKVVQIIEAEIHKDVVDFQPEKIREYLPPVL